MPTYPDSTQVFLNQLHAIAATTGDIEPLHNRARHLARCVLAVIEYGQGTSFIFSKGLKEREYSEIKFWLKCLECNGLTMRDRASLAQNIIDIYIKSIEAIDSSALVTHSGMFYSE